MNKSVPLGQSSKQKHRAIFVGDNNSGLQLIEKVIQESFKHGMQTVSKCSHAYTVFNQVTCLFCLPGCNMQASAVSIHLCFIDGRNQTCPLNAVVISCLN